MAFEINEFVRVKAELSRKDFMAPQHLKKHRTPSAMGHIYGTTQSYYLVRHKGAQLATAYLEEELEPLDLGYWRVDYEHDGSSYFKDFRTYEEAVHYSAAEGLLGNESCVISGPFFDEKPLTEGVVPTKSLYEVLLQQRDEHDTD